MKLFNKRFLIAAALALLLVTAGCNSNKTGNVNAGEEVGNSTGVNLEGVQPGESYYYEIKVTEKNQLGLVQAQSPFVMDSSLERENLIRRYQYLNDRNNVHHVYLIDEGQVISYFVAQGKVSSVNSKLTNDKQIVRAAGCEADVRGDGVGSEGACFKPVESPQMDGSYGENGDAIFFFTTGGQYVESSLDYVVSEEPKNINDEVILRENVNSSE